MPRYDSASMFGALLGTEDHGRWPARPSAERAQPTRSYEGDSFIADHPVDAPPTGVVEVDRPHAAGDRPRRHHPPGAGHFGTRRDDPGALRIRFGYAAAMPWVRKFRGRRRHALVAVAGPDAVVVRGPRCSPTDHEHAGRFTVAAGEIVDVTMTWYPSHREPPAPLDVDAQLAMHRDWWEDWAGIFEQHGAYADAVRAVPARPAGADPRGHRRHRRRGDDVAAGGLRRQRATGTTGTSGCGTPR